MRWWLMKSEPESFSIADLERLGESAWDGVRNYQARNFMRDEMAVGDGVLFYHSNAKPSGVAGLARVCGPAIPDHSSWNPDSPYFDPASTPQQPRWWMVTVAFQRRLPRVVSLDEIRNLADCEDMILVQRSRLSVQPCEAHHVAAILAVVGER